MPDPFRIPKPDPVYSSPKRFQQIDPFDDDAAIESFDTRTSRTDSPSKTAMRYSPAVKFGRRDSSAMAAADDFSNSTIANRFVMAASEQGHRGSFAESDLYPQPQQQPPVTPRSKFTQMESPKRFTPVVASPTRFKRTVTGETDFGKSVGSDKSSRVLPPPKPIFSASTFAAANHDQPLDLHQTASYSSQDTYATNGYLKEKGDFAASVFSDATTTAGDDEDAMNKFASSLDGHMFEDVPTEFQPRREIKVTQKTFHSKNGNLVLDNPIPSTLAKFLPQKSADEFEYMRYSAVTSGPDEFEESGFNIRAKEMNRSTELLIAITMYNEDEVALARTLHAVFKNIAYLQKRQQSSTWGANSWQKIVVMIIADGRTKVKPGVFELLSAIGVYQEGIAKSFVNSKPVNCHMFEYTTQLSIDENLVFQSDEKGLVPVQIVFCMKEKNAQKINSHRWLFNGVCPILEPNVCILLDVGTVPHDSAIYHLWKSFDLDSNVAGAAGEILTMKGKYWKNLLNPIVASQNFEYKMSNILDKPCESVYGYISVLPGALSAYRYSALQNHEDGTGPLHSYFKGERGYQSDEKSDIFTANMYLAEDRILAWELVSKRDAKWVLKYVRAAKGETDVPETLSEFISQRRRWLNGAFFAAIYSQLHFRSIWKTDHSAMRKFFFHIEFIYQFLTTLFSIFSVANFYLAFYYMVGSLSTNESIPNNGGFWIFQIMNYICMCCLASMFVISMGNRPQGAPKLYMLSVIVLTFCGSFAIISGFVYMCQLIKAHSLGEVSGLSFANIVVSLGSTYGLYVLMSIVYLDPWHLLSSAPQYFMLLPSYTCLLQIYAFCNTHDVSWGTKGENNPKTNLGSAIITQTESGEEVIKVDIVGDQRDIDSIYAEVLYKLKERRKQPLKMREGFVQAPPPSDEDYYRDLRSRVVLIWLILNLVLIMTVTQVYKPGSIKTNGYLMTILWSVFGFALFRALGSFAYLFHLLLRWVVVSHNKWEIRKGLKEEE
ncbi:unnamed protein product [Kuraishia capsulata CBS 1993]|uniref:Chitin synthase n=1 Tax=Kuraishia capsulata CBS 1993 TaxID=1382522 RepID=W6MTV5_9ASCO|nr:uncharacterized protein KUCA_T00004676001 [Kuraishia capsulata CBS 1993]CDK28692.1 unnamed protein product [Kuraishia capsulata CBS 1993]